MGNPVFDWIAPDWQMKHPRRSGSVLACTEKLEAKGERSSSSAVTETTIPMLDGSTKEPAWIKVRFAPERSSISRVGKGLRADPRSGEAVRAGETSTRDCGLDCSKVHKSTVHGRQSIAHDGLGELAGDDRRTQTLSFPISRYLRRSGGRLRGWNGSTTSCERGMRRGQGEEGQAHALGPQPAAPGQHQPLQPWGSSGLDRSIRMRARTSSSSRGASLTASGWNSAGA